MMDVINISTSWLNFRICQLLNIPNQIFMNLHIVIPSSIFGDIVLCGAAVHMIPSIQRRAAITHQSMPNTLLSLCQTCQTCIYSCWFNLNTALPLPSVCKKSRMALTTSQAPMNPSKTKWLQKMSRLWCLCKKTLTSFIFPFHGHWAR